MQHSGPIIKSIKNQFKRFGAKKGLFYTIDRLLNFFIFFDCFHVITMDRNRAIFPKMVEKQDLDFRFATRKDLENLMNEGKWDINTTKIAQFNDGDLCLLTYYKSELAGYTWAHLEGSPLLIPGFRIKIPNNYIYNYAGFTLPKFRGKKLQSCRHYHLANQPQWPEKNALLGYVKHTNWSSIRGQTRSGYQSMGRIWMLGIKRKFFVFMSDSVKSLGIERIAAG